MLIFSIVQVSAFIIGALIFRFLFLHSHYGKVYDVKYINIPLFMLGILGACVPLLGLASIVMGFLSYVGDHIKLNDEENVKNHPLVKFVIKILYSKF